MQGRSRGNDVLVDQMSVIRHQQPRAAGISTTSRESTVEGVKHCDTVQVEPTCEGRRKEDK